MKKKLNVEHLQLSDKIINRFNNCQFKVFITCKLFSSKEILSLTKNNHLITNYNKN